MGKARETEAGLGILAGAGMLSVVQRHSSVPGSRCSENTGMEGKEKVRQAMPRGDKWLSVHKAQG